LSRRAAQEDCMRDCITRLTVGDVIEARVTHLEQFGCFVDIGCGLPSLIPIDAISVSRISHPADRFTVGQLIRAVVRSVDCGRICLSHKELLGTWLENASRYHAGETVSGIVRSVEDYGVFVELAPNLAGLAEPKEGMTPGQSVSVYIKAVIPEKMKIKLVIVDTGEEKSSPAGFRYFTESGHISEWVYSTEGSPKLIMSSFE
ncbi:MAG: S1 RNA-binding domain-containing protein, partial [Ruminococcus sp.]|nr:S1 RNA-binding domain-containing protein [Ruminococcus sp.]